MQLPFPAHLLILARNITCGKKYVNIFSFSLFKRISKIRDLKAFFNDVHFLTGSEMDVFAFVIFNRV
jgi:hypothetical protein